MKNQLACFFTSLGATLLCAAFIAALYSIDTQTAAVIGYTPDYPHLPQKLMDAQWLGLLKSVVRLLFPYGQPLYELMFGLFGGYGQSV